MPAIKSSSPSKATARVATKGRRPRIVPAARSMTTTPPVAELTAAQRRSADSSTEKTFVKPVGSRSRIWPLALSMKTMSPVFVPATRRSGER